MRSKNTIALSLLVLTFSQIVRADPATDRELLLSCDRAVGTCQGALAAKDTLNTQLSSQVDALSKENAALRNRGSGILESPFLYFLLGMGVTALTVHLVK